MQFFFSPLSILCPITHFHVIMQEERKHATTTGVCSVSVQRALSIANSFTVRPLFDVMTALHRIYFLFFTRIFTFLPFVTGLLMLGQNEPSTKIAPSEECAFASRRYEWKMVFRGNSMGRSLHVKYMVSWQPLVYSPFIVVVAVIDDER